MSAPIFRKKHAAGTGSYPADKLVAAIGAAGERTVFAGFSCLAVSSDGRHVYAEG